MVGNWGCDIYRKCVQWFWVAHWLIALCIDRSNNIFLNFMANRANNSWVTSLIFERTSPSKVYLGFYAYKKLGSPRHLKRTQTCIGREGPQGWLPHTPKQLAQEPAKNHKCDDVVSMMLTIVHRCFCVSQTKHCPMACVCENLLNIIERSHNMGHSHK